MIGYQSAGEDVRQAATRLNAQRQQRQATREAILAASFSTARATSQGARTSDSAVQGASAQITGQLGGNLLGIRQALTSSDKLFDLNRNITQSYLNYQDKSLGFLEQRQELERQQRQSQQRVIELGGQSSGISGQIAEYQSAGALGSGIAGIGGLLLGNAGTISSNIQSFPGLFGGTSSSSINTGFGVTSGNYIQ